MTVADRPAHLAVPDHDHEPGAEERLDARQLAERLGAILGDIGANADPRIAERTEDLVSLLMQFYGAGIQRMMELADEAGVLEDQLLRRFVDDELVSSMLVIHDLHPVDLATRVQVALDKVRPYLGSHGGDVEITGIEGDVVHVRMEGSCSSCPSSTITLNYAIEKAILDAAPEISRIEAEGVQAEPNSPLIQLQPRPGHGEAGGRGVSVPTRTDWLLLEPGERPNATGLLAITLAGLPILLCQSGADLYAYRDRCPSCRSRLADGRLSGDELRCGICGQTFDIRRAGRAAGDGDLHLEPLPLLSDGASVRIAVPAPVMTVGVDGVVGAAVMTSR